MYWKEETFVRVVLNVENLAKRCAEFEKIK